MEPLAWSLSIEGVPEILMEGIKALIMPSRFCLDLLSVTMDSRTV